MPISTTERRKTKRDEKEVATVGTFPERGELNDPTKKLFF
jgi:hypothetical protein